MAVSLNLTVGISGELSLGHAGFMSVGAFAGIVASGWLLSATGMENETLRLIVSMVVGGVFAGIAGVIIGIPVLRLHGDYLAIVTLAFGEIIRNVLNCLYISIGPGSVRSVVDPSNAAATTKAVMMDKLHIQFNSAPPSDWQVLVNGPAGATGVAKISTFVIGFALVLFTLFVVLNLVNSRSGRAIMAIRDSRIAAESVGINITKYKMMAFVTSAFLAGMAGALFGLNYSTVTASKFKFDTSISDAGVRRSGRHRQHSRLGHRRGAADRSARAAARLCRLPHAGLRRGAHRRHARHQQPGASLGAQPRDSPSQARECEEGG